MPKPLFRTKANRIKSPAEHKAQAERTKVVKTIRRICEQKKGGGQISCKSHLAGVARLTDGR